MSLIGTAYRKGNWLIGRGCLANLPEGWLADPNGKLLLLFHKDPISLQRLPLFYIDKWDSYPVVTPNAFINRRIVHLEQAIEKWNELLKNGWEKLEHQFGESE